MTDDASPIEFGVTLERREIRAFVISYLLYGPNLAWFAYCTIALIVTATLGARDLIANDLAHGIFEAAFAGWVLWYLASTPARTTAAMLRRYTDRQPMSYAFSRDGIAISDASDSVRSFVKWSAVPGYVRRPETFVFLLGRVPAVVPVAAIPAQRATEFEALIAAHSRPVRRYPAA